MYVFKHMEPTGSVVIFLPLILIPTPLCPLHSASYPLFHLLIAPYHDSTPQDKSTLSNPPCTAHSRPRTHSQSKSQYSSRSHTRTGSRRICPPCRTVRCLYLRLGSRSRYSLRWGSRSWGCHGRGGGRWMGHQGWRQG